jgi:hypothetical protein
MQYLTGLAWLWWRKLVTYDWLGGEHTHPKNLYKALPGPKSREAMQEEMNALYKNKT